MVTVAVSKPLTKTEQHIVNFWFSAAEAVCVDPWFGPITNGRHRLWSTLAHFGDRLVPVAATRWDMPHRPTPKFLGTRGMSCIESTSTNSQRSSGSIGAIR